MSTVIIVHRWGADSDSDWIPWLRTELEKRGVKVLAPDMPDTNRPRIDSWVTTLASVADGIGEDTYFVGHSVGCQTILRYLSSLPKDQKVGGAVFVAGWTTLKPLESHEEEMIARPWIDNSIEWDTAVSHTSSFVCIYSQDDPYVPVENAQLFKEKLNAKLVLDENRGHFTEDEDVTQLPSLLDELLLIMGLPVETKLI